MFRPVLVLATGLLAAACAAPGLHRAARERPESGEPEASDSAVACDSDPGTPRSAPLRSTPFAGLDDSPIFSAIDVAEGEDGEEGEEDDQAGLTSTDELGDDRPPHPFEHLSDGELERRLLDDPASLGSMSLGKAGAGALWNGVKMPAGDRWEIVDPPNSWGTKETVDFIVGAIAAVHDQHPGTPKLHVGDLSRKGGGPLRPHVSHQSGRDVDLGFYYKTECRWYTRGREDNIDVPRTWSLVKAFVTETDVELILLDRRLQALLRRHALQVGEDPSWLADLFDGGSGRRALVRHARGHATHLHVRFHNPVAQETGRRMYGALLKHGMVKAPSYFVRVKASKGQTLQALARQHGVSERSIRRANGLRSSRIRAGAFYKIPGTGGVSPPGPVVVPPRRLPPALRAASASPGG